MNINELLTGDISGYNEQEKNYILEYREALKETLIDILQDSIKTRILNEQSFLENIVLFGFKGVNNVPLNTLMQQVADICGEEALLECIDKVEI